MKIRNLRLLPLSVPLRRAFKTARRSVDHLEDLVLFVETDGAIEGLGAAPPTGLVTGDTAGAIAGALTDHIAPALVGRDAEDLEGNLAVLEASIVGNGSAKAAADIALHDLWAKVLGQPLWALFGGGGAPIFTDITISVNDPDEMARDAVDAVGRGYRTLKIKVGKERKRDFERIAAIRSAVGSGPALRLDANQGWKPGEAVRLLEAMEEASFAIELVEQPVAAHDLEGMAHVTAHSPVPVVADESVRTSRDALRIFQLGAAHMINIKLMKCGGLGEARRLIALAETFGAEVMFGSMLEGKISAAAAVHLASARRAVGAIDIDGPLLCADDPYLGGPQFLGPEIVLSREPGLGVRGLRDCALP